MAYHWNGFKQYNQIHILGRPLCGITSTNAKTCFQPNTSNQKQQQQTKPTYLKNWRTEKHEVRFPPHTTHTKVATALKT